MVRVPGFEPGFPRWQRGVITATLHSLGKMLNKTGFSKRRYPILPTLILVHESRHVSF